MAMEMALSWGPKREPEMGPQISLTCNYYKASAEDLSGTKGLPGQSWYQQGLPKPSLLPTRAG